MAVDPEVSRLKLQREIEDYLRLEHEYRTRGWFLVKADFPEVFVLFCAPQLKPPAVVFGALLDFTDYDLQPPSVLLVNPFTREPYKNNELPSPLFRRTSSSGEQVEFASLMQSELPDGVPYLCLPGVREYHAHPAHSGDPWLLHRGKGEGTLLFVLNQLYRYGVQPLTGYGFELQVTLKGFNIGVLPE